MCNLHPVFVNHLKDSYAAKPGETDILLLPIIYNKHKNGDIITISNSPFIISKLSSLGLYVFSDVDTAREYFNLIREYDFQKKKTCTFGQGFWPKFRELITLSVNNNQIENIPIKKSIEQF